jgi:hypothetical protein
MLRLENQDSYPFEPMLGPSFAARTLAPGSKVTVPLRAGDVESIACTPEAPCGRTDLVVFFHPVFAVTDAHGAFRIEHFPTSQLVRVTAWHPLFDASETYVWLQPGEHIAVELELTPKSRFAKNDDDQ